MDGSEEKHSEDAISPDHHPASRLRGPLPAVPPTVRVTARGDDCCYDSGVGELKYTHHTVPFYEGLNTLGTMETDVDGEVAYSVNNYSPSRRSAPTAAAAKLGKKPHGPCVSVTCVAALTSAIALLLVLAAIACGLLVYFGILPFDTFVTTEQARQLQANISAWNSQSDETARQLDRLRAELAALQATTAQLRATITSLRASLNGTNGTAINNSTSIMPPPNSYSATLLNLTLFQGCRTKIPRTCTIIQGSATLCSTSGYTLSPSGFVTVDVFCATANTAETNVVVATLDVDASNSALCNCNVVPGPPTASTACNLHVTECPSADSFTTAIQTYS